MSESTIPFEGQTMTEAPPVPADEVNTSGNRTKMLALVGVAVLLVMAVLAYLLVFSGGSDDADAVTPTTPRAVAPVEQPAAPATDTTRRTKLTGKTFGRDPFKALIVEAVDVEPTAGDTTTTGGSATGSGTSDTTGSTGGTSTTTTTTVPNETKAHTFKVLDVAPDSSRISVRVDGDVYRNLKAGEVFATYFKVVLISGTVNSFQFGDDKFNVVGTKKLTIA